MAILTEKHWIGFRGGADKKIIKGLFDRLKRKQNEFDDFATRTVKKQFGLFATPINYDNDPGKSTGYTQKTTKAYSFWGANRLVTRFITPNDAPSRDGKLRGYAVFPLLGKSTSKKYGERNWLLAGAKATRKEASSIFRK